MSRTLDFGWLSVDWPTILGGAWVAIYLLLITAVLGTLLSLLGTTIRRGPIKPLRYFVGAYIELFRNTPFLAQLFFIFFGLPSFGIRLGAQAAAVLAMTLNYAAYGTVIFGAGIDAVPKGQTEAAAALGLKPSVVFLRIVFPQAMRVVFPALASQTVIMLLETAAVSQISVTELTYAADLIQSRTFRSFEVYLIITSVYLAMGLTLRRILDLLGRYSVGRW